jgi:hypothetical protein
VQGEARLQMWDASEHLVPHLPLAHKGCDSAVWALPGAVAIYSVVVIWGNRGSLYYGTLLLCNMLAACGFSSC